MDDEIEKIVNNFDKIDDVTYFMKEQISKFKPITPKINFENCHIALSKNGGLIAFVRRHKLFIMDKKDPIRDSVRIFFQDGSSEKRIKFPYDKDDQYIIYFDFTDEEVLYAIMTDGTLFKIEIFSNRVVEKTTGTTFKNDKIVSAKFFMRGFVALTQSGCFYVVNSFKEMSPVLFFDMRKFLGITYVPTYLFLPPNAGKTNKIELFIPVIKKEELPYTPLPGDPLLNAGPKYIGHGIINICQQEKFEVSESGGINGVYYIRNKKILPWDERCGLDAESPGDIPQIWSMCASPDSKRIALCSRNGHIAIYESIIEGERPPVFEKLNFHPKIKEEEDKNEQLAVMTLDDPRIEFNFCGNDAVCLSGKRYLFLVPVDGGQLVYKMTNKSNMGAQMGTQFMKCVTEVDGLRVLMTDSVHFINQVPDDLFDACYPFSEKPCKRLINAYNAAENKDANCDKLIRELEKELPGAILALQKAATSLWKKDVQMFMLKAAQHGKNFIQKEEFNFDDFVDVCKNIRIINNLRESEHPRLITYQEFKSLTPMMNPKELIKRILQTQDFYLAFQISKYLDYNVKKVYQKFAIAQIKHLDMGLSEKEEIEAFERISRKLEEVSNISYIKLAKKAFKFEKQVMGMKFLEKEKSLLTKIPQYIELKQWTSALNLALQTYDSNVVTTVLDKIMKLESLKDFFYIVSKNDRIDSAVIDYLRKNLPNELPNYLSLKRNDEELFFVYLENFFKSKNVADRRDLLAKARQILEKLEAIKDTTFDVKFYKAYLMDLIPSINLKRDLINENVVYKDTDLQPFDNSVLDIYRDAIKAKKYGYVEKKNNEFFKLPQKMVSNLRIRTYAEMGDCNVITDMYKGDFKKYALTPINFAEIFIENGLKDLAVESISKVTDPEYFDYKVELLKQANFFDAALQVIISDKNCENERKDFMVKDILSKRPDLLDAAQNYCKTYKVNLGI